MIAFRLTDIKDFMAHLLLSPTFDNFLFVEGEIITFNTFTIDGYIQKKFVDTENPPVYSSWKDVREYCFSIIKGKKVPLSFKFIFGLSPENTEKLLTQVDLGFSKEDIQGLFLNIRYDGEIMRCTTGTALHTFTLDKSLEQAWDKMVQKFFLQQQIAFEV